MHIHLNCAVSQDGFLAGPGGAQVRLSDAIDLRRVHKLRASVDAILVGSGTVLKDNPSLGVKRRYATGPDPLRVVLDRRGRVPDKARVFRDANVLALDSLSLPSALGELQARGIQSVLVEGGAQVWQAFWASGLWSVATVYVAPQVLGAGVALPKYRNQEMSGRKPDRAQVQGEGQLLTWVNPG